MDQIDTSDVKAGNTACEVGHGAVGRRPTNLSGRILVAFHASCDRRDLEVAGSLLNIFEGAALTDAGEAADRKRHALDLIVAAHERLWHLKHPRNAGGRLVDAQEVA